MYHVYAKLVGPFLSSRKISLGHCEISKRTTAPTSLRSGAFGNLDLEDFCKKQGIEEYIQYPQGKISVRKVESRFFMEKTIEARDISHAVEMVRPQFERIVSCLSVCAKLDKFSRGRATIKHYDFEIVGAMKSGESLESLPFPLVAHANFFPKAPPRNFLSLVKRVIASSWTIELPLRYYQEAMEMKCSGHYKEWIKRLLLMKSIEAVCNDLVPEGTKTPHKTKKNGCLTKMTTKERLRETGNMLGISATHIMTAISAWNDRNTKDIAHAGKGRHFPHTGNDDLEAAAAQFIFCRWEKGDLR